MTQQQRLRLLSPLIIFVLLGWGLRLYQLADSPIRGDEAFAIQYWAAPWPDALVLAGEEPHPLGTFALFALWKSTFGDGEWVMRLLPALLSLPGMAATYVLGKLLFNHHRAAALAAFLYAVHPFLVWHAQDVRNYAIWTSTAAVAMAAFLMAVKHNRLINWLVYVIATSISAYIFFLDPFFLVAQGVFLIATRHARFRSWMMAVLATGILLIPWGIQLYTLAGSGYGGTAGQFAPDQLLTVFPPILFIGYTLPEQVLHNLWIILLPSIIGMIAILWRAYPKPAALFIGIGLLIPMSCLSVIAAVMDVFRPRYIMPIIPLLLVAISAAIVYLAAQKSRLLKTTAVGIVVALLLMDGWALANYYWDPAYAKAPNWRDLGAYITAYTEPGDLVVQQALDPGFTYYFRGPADETTLPLSPNAPAQETQSILEENLSTRRAIWLIPGAPDGYDDEQVPLTWLSDNAQPTLDINLAGFRVMEFRSWEVPVTEYASLGSHTFDETAILHGWTVDRPAPDRLRLIAYWEPLAQTDEPLSGFLHLIGPPRPADGLSLWTQDDHRIPNEGTNTEAWTVGTVYRDIYLLTLPAEQTGGDWALHLGLYNPSTLDRVPVGGSDHIEITLSDFPP